MATNTQTQVDLEVAPKVAFGFSSKVGALSSAVLGVLTAVDAIINGGLTASGIATLAGAVLVLMSVIGIRGAQAAAAIKAVGESAKAPLIVTSGQPQVEPARERSSWSREVDREPSYEPPSAEDEERDIHEIDEHLEG